MATPPNFYDDVTYPALPYAHTHPSCLATMALLHGLQPAPVEHCRVLEIGCNAAANLIPMAYGLPRSEFVGFDYAALPIARGQAQIQALGLTNIRVLRADLMEAAGIPELDGQFDYILAHGLYAWIPAPVRDRLLAFCGERLAPHGVAFISYNALPGSHVRSLARDVLRHAHKHEVRTPEEVVEALSFLRFVAESRPAGDGMRVLLERELESAAKRTPESVFHDEMSSNFRPVLFEQFAAHAVEHGLQFLGEAEIPGPLDPSFQPEVMPKIQAMAGGDFLAQEQLLDLMRLRTYRESLVCRAEAEISHELRLDALQHLWLSSEAASTPGRLPTSRIFTLPSGIRIESEHPATITFMEQLIVSYPEPVHFSAIAASLEGNGIPLHAEVFTMLFRLVVARMVNLDAWRPPVQREVPERPLASRLCREQAIQDPNMTTLLHTTMSLTDPVCRQLVRLLDGTRDRAALLADLGTTLPEVSPETLATGLDGTLGTLASAGVLEQPAAELR